MGTKWDCFDGWLLPQSNSSLATGEDWGVFDSLVEIYQKILESKKKELIDILRFWDDAFKVYGGDPCRMDSSTFRPLRLSREEDWSDWLIFLFQESETGDFAKILFTNSGISFEKLGKPDIHEREVEVFSSGYRADIVFGWNKRTIFQIEVKIGDWSFDKTPGTAEAMKKHYTGKFNNWFDFILLLSNQKPYWEETADRLNCRFIKSLTWEEIAIALRKCLLISKERITWNVWAYSYLCSIEQKLLFFPPILDEQKPLIDYSIENHIRILTEARDGSK